MRAACLFLALVLAACSDRSSESAEPEGPPTAAAPAEPREPAAAFRYTSLEGCTLTRSAPEEAGFFEHLCAGEAGYRLRHVEADLRENLTVLTPDGAQHSLDLPALADGAFSSLGETVEWRGSDDAGSFAPNSLIVRQTAMEDPDPQVPEVSYLVVARLEPRPCVLGRVPPGPEQNRRARELADGGAPCPNRGD